MGVLAYLGPLVLIPLLIARTSPQVQLHLKQGIVLLLGEFIVFCLIQVMLFFLLPPFVTVFNFVFMVFSLWGIGTVVMGSTKELPIIGTLATRLPI